MNYLFSCSSSLLGTWHHFLATGFFTTLLFTFFSLHTSLVTITHSSVGPSLGISFVTFLQVTAGSKEHFIFGAFWTTDWVLSKHSSSPSENPHSSPSQSLIRVVEQKVIVLTVCSCSILQFFLKVSSHSSSCSDL